MAKTAFLNVPSGLEAGFDLALQSGDRLTYSSIKVKPLFSSRTKQKGLTQKSLLVSLAPIWAGFSDAVKAAWTSAGAKCDMSGWKLFVQDTGLRMKNSLSGYSTPSDLYQSMIGCISIASPATGLQIEQLHPFTYYVYKKVTGTKSEYSPVLITESFSLPVTISISSKCILTSLGAGSHAYFYLDVISSYQGENLHTFCLIDLSLSSDWKNQIATLSAVKGLIQGYTAFIEIVNATGDLYFDNVSIEHNGLNWARDPFCDSIQTEFTKRFEQIPKNWAPTNLVSGAYYLSQFHG